MVAFIPGKPGHDFKYAFKGLNETQYVTYAKQYSRAKAGGIRCVYSWASGAGVLGVVKDISKGVVIDYGKRKFAAVCINAGAYIVSPAVVVFTNASKIVKASKTVHSTAAFVFECMEDTTNLAFLPADLLLFGRPIPVGAADRFNLLNHTDFLDV